MNHIDIAYVCTYVRTYQCRYVHMYVYTYARMYVMWWKVLLCTQCITKQYEYEYKCNCKVIYIV